MGVIASISSGDAARLLVCSAVALLMVPGLALFYGGRTLVRSAAMALPAVTVAVGLQWMLFGYSLAFGPSIHGMFGRLTHPCLMGLVAQMHGGVSALAFAIFQMTRAVVGAGIVACAFSGKLQTRAYLAVAVLWSTLVYDPITHWVWGDRGWLAALGAVDFAGGTVVHLAAGVSALVCLVFANGLGDQPNDTAKREGGVSTWVGVGLFGCSCFGLVAGDALSGRGLGVEAFVATALGAIGGAAGWMVGESGADKPSPSSIGLGSGVVVGLAAIGVAGGYVSPWAALAIGFISGALCRGNTRGVTAGLVAGLLSVAAAAGYVSPLTAFSIAGFAGTICYAAVRLRRRLGSDESFDVFGVHAMGGLAGGLLTGVLAHNGANGALFGNVRQLAVQLVACVATAAYAALVTRAILLFVDATVRLSPRDSRAPSLGPGSAALDAPSSANPAA